MDSNAFVFKGFLKSLHFLFILLSCYLYLGVDSVPPCVKDLRYHPNLIIHARQSLDIGAKFLVKLSVNSLKDCYFACCNITSCTDALYRSKAPHECFLFSCASTDTCVYADHEHYDVFTTGIRHGQRKNTAVGLDQHCDAQKTCVTNNSICSDGLCSCSSGWTKKFGRCVLSVCRLPDAQFQCDDSSACVAVYNRCNGVIDCSDGSDENGCSSDDQQSKPYKDTGNVLAMTVNATKSRLHHPSSLPVAAQEVAHLGRDKNQPSAVTQTLSSNIARISSTKELNELPDDPEMDLYRHNSRVSEYESNDFDHHHRYSSRPMYYSSSPWNTALDTVDEQDSTDIWSQTGIPAGFDSIHQRKFQPILRNRPTFLVAPLSHDGIPSEQHALLPKSHREEFRSPQYVTDIDDQRNARQRWLARQAPYGLVNSPQSPYYGKQLEREEFEDMSYPHDDEEYLPPDYHKVVYPHGKPTRFVSSLSGNPMRFKGKHDEDISAEAVQSRYDHLPTMESGIPLNRISKHMESKHIPSIQGDSRFALEDNHQLLSPESVSTKVKASHMTVASALSRSQSEGHTAALILTFSMGLLCCFIGFLVAEWWRRRRRRPYIHRSYYSVNTTNDAQTINKPKKLSNSYLTPGTQFHLFSKRSRHPTRSGGPNFGTDQPEETNALCENLAL